MAKKIKSRRLMWGGHIARVEEGGNGLKGLTENLQEINWGCLWPKWKNSIRVDFKKK